MNNKLKGGYTMKITNIALTVFLVATLLGAAFAGAVEIGDVISADTAVASAASVASSISAVDAVEVETEIEDEIAFESSTKSTVSKGHGWIVAGQKGALLDILFVTREGKSSDGDTKSISKGWLRTGNNLKLKLESTASTADGKTFAVTARDGSVRGTLKLTKSQAYQTGFAIWNGDLDLKIKNESFSAKATAAIEEKQAKGSSNSGSGRSGGISSDATGTLVLGANTYTLAGEAKNLKKLEFKIKGENNVVGELKLESRNLGTYIGKIKIEEIGDEDDRLSGKVTATLRRDGNTLYGPIKIELDGSSATDLASLEGDIKIVLSQRAVDDDDDDSDSDDDDDSDDKKDKNRSGSNSGSDSRGFWKKFKGFFGAG